MGASDKIGVLLVNTGSPSSPNPEDVSKYLRQFLMDERVIDIPWLFRWWLVNVGIVPKRAPVTASQYGKIWEENGSPLLSVTAGFSRNLQTELGENYLVNWGMRYGDPSIASRLSRFRSQGIERLLLFPLYPQYSEAATGSAIAEVRKLWKSEFTVVPPFFDRSEFLDPVAEVSKNWLEKQKPQKVIFSFHGLPQHQDNRAQRRGKGSYRAQCFETGARTASRLGLEPQDYTISFQSRLGRRPWISPYTDSLYRELPKQGVKRIAVICPSFVTDCLETLEEVSVRGKTEFLKHGGDELTLVPCVNDTPGWVRGAAEIVRSTPSRLFS